MATATSNEAAAPDPLPGIVIQVPTTTEGHRRMALLLAAMGAPPQRPGGAAWRQCVLSICRCYWDEWNRTEPSWQSTQGSYFPEELILDRSLARTSLEKTLEGLNTGLAAADLLKPYFKRALAISQRFNVPKEVEKITRKSEIEKTLDREAVYRQSLGAGAEEILPKRMPENSAASADTNFASRNLRPFRSVWHIIVAFSMVMDEWARSVEQAATQERRSSKDLHISPQLDWWYLARFPAIFDRTIKLAEFLEQAIPYLELKHADQHEVVRLRLV